MGAGARSCCVPAGGLHSLAQLCPDSGACPSFSPHGFLPPARPWGPSPVPSLVSGPFCPNIWLGEHFSSVSCDPVRGPTSQPCDRLTACPGPCHRRGTDRMFCVSAVISTPLRHQPICFNLAPPLLINALTRALCYLTCSHDNHQIKVGI